MSQAPVYADSGVNIACGSLFVEMIRERIAKAWPSCAREIGGFSGELQLPRPTQRLSAGADGAGTVAILGALTGQWSVIGTNAAAMSLVDTYVSGAWPVALLDVLDVGRLYPETHIKIIDGIINACLAAEPCVLLGGETAEVPDMFKYFWMVNVNTTTIGVPGDGIITRHVRPGQPVYGWPSNGPASNGFSLIRKVLNLKGDPEMAKEILSSELGCLGCRLAEALLVPTPVWVNEIEEQRLRGVRFAAHAHITGGGMVGNIPRVLPDNCRVVIDRSCWKRPAIFRLIQEQGRISLDEMDTVFNQGIMVVSIIDGDIMPTTSIAIHIGFVETRKDGEPQVVFVGSFND